MRPQGPWNLGCEVSKKITTNPTRLRVAWHMAEPTSCICLWDKSKRKKMPCIVKNGLHEIGSSHCAMLAHSVVSVPFMTSDVNLRFLDWRNAVQPLCLIFQMIPCCSDQVPLGLLLQLVHRENLEACQPGGSASLQEFDMHRQ